MKVKSFTADTVAGALRKVRGEMGGDAIVLKTRRIASPLGVERAEVTACISDEQIPEAALNRNTGNSAAVSEEPETVAAQASPQEVLVQENPLNESLAQKLDQIRRLLSGFMLSADENSQLKEIRSFNRLLRDADFTDEFVKALFDKAIQSITEQGTVAHQSFLKTNLVEELSAVMLPEVIFNAGDRVLFAGPAGAGKSSAMGKLAAHLIAHKHHKVTLASIDDFKIGGSEELNSYADLLGLETFSNTELPQSQSPDSQAILLIDSPAVPSEESDRTHLINRVNQLKPTHRLVVFSSITRATDLKDLVESYRPLNPTHLVMTMLDLTNRYGGLMAAAQTLNCKLGFTTDAPGGIGDIHAPDPAAMVRRILRCEEELCKD